MKRMYYVSSFARPLSERDLADIHETAVRNNRRGRVTGILVCLGDTFFQVLEGPVATVDRLYHEKIVSDRRHKDVHCLKSETGVKKRMFPEWNMKVFDLNNQTDALPFAFRQMLSALLESSRTIAHYTQPSVFEMLARGVNPISVPPRRRQVTVLYSDVIGFSRFAEHLPADELIQLVNTHVDVCTRHVTENGGQVNKLTGDGVLAYFSDKTSDAALKTALRILRGMRQQRARAPKGGAARLLYGGVGMASGLVYEGNIGHAEKRDFTILGNTVNLAARLESLTRDLNVRLSLNANVVTRAADDWPFASLGKHRLKGQSRSMEVFSLGSLPRLEVRRLYDRIEDYVRCRQ